ncbi:MAG: TetR/AcrR family transcriptional regulator [Thermocrispum sp.]
MTEVSDRSYSGRPVQEWKAARRERLLAAALELFASEGYQSTSIERLCATAKVSTRHFYQEFGNKESVLIAVHEDGVRHGMEQAAAELAAELAAAPPAPIQERLRRALTAYLHTVMADPRLARIAFVEVVGVSIAVEEQRLGFREAIVGLIDAEGQAAVRRGELAPRDFRFLGMALIGAVNATVYDWLLHEPQPPAAQLQASIVRLALDMLGVREG